MDFKLTPNIELQSLHDTAQMAELVDALVSGTSGRKVVQVRFLFWAQAEKALVTQGFFGVKDKSTTMISNFHFIIIYIHKNSGACCKG